MFVYRRAYLHRNGSRSPCVFNDGRYKSRWFATIKCNGFYIRLWTSSCWRCRDRLDPITHMDNGMQWSLIVMFLEFVTAIHHWQYPRIPYQYWKNVFVDARNTSHIRSDSYVMHYKIGRNSVQVTSTEIDDHLIDNGPARIRQSIHLKLRHHKLTLSS